MREDNRDSIQITDFKIVYCLGSRTRTLKKIKELYSCKKWSYLLKRRVNVKEMKATSVDCREF